MEEKTLQPAGNENGQEVSYGKFKSAEELLKAYNALQSEFTKRSQILKEYEKKMSGYDWEGKVSAFVDKYPIAEKYTEELATEIANNGELKDVENGLEKALLSVLSSKVKTADEMAADENVIDKVINNEAVREKIISQYLKGFESGTLPVTLPKGGAIPVTPPLPARNIREAGRIAQKIIESE